MTPTPEQPSPNSLAAIPGLSPLGPAHLSMPAVAPGLSALLGPASPHVAHLPLTHLPPRRDLPKPPVFQGPVPRPPPSGVFPTVPSPPLGCHLPSLPCSQPFGPCLSPSLEWELTAGRDHGCSTRATWHKVWRAGQECGASSPTAEPTPCPAQPGCPSPAPPGCRR